VRVLGFRLKLLLATMLVVLGVTAATVLVTERSVEATHRALLQDRFASEVTLFEALQDARLALVKGRSLDVAASVRLVAAMDEGEPELVYRIALDELRDVLRPDPHAPDPRSATFFRLIDASARVVPAPDPRAGLPEGGEWETQIARVAGALGPRRPQSVGYLAPYVDGRRALHEVLVTRIADPVTERTLGALALGFPVQSGGARGDGAPIESGIWLDGHLYGAELPADLVGAVPAVGDATIRVAGTLHRVFSRSLHPGSGFPPAYRVGLSSRAEAAARGRDLRRRIVGSGLVALLAGLVLSLLLARSLSGPLEAVVAATGEVQRGNLGVRIPVHVPDEIGRLAEAFNEMTAGLALKERYRSVLDVVTDREVAQQLIDGKLALGGELRQATTLFCDIRDFTTLTSGMPPEDVIALLNEHMTALTRVVAAHGGIIDKFVGDSLMAVFGVPRSGGDDAGRAVQAARRMMAERTALNASATQRITVGIGIASGTVVAGCMGAADRLNYTVLGEPVNLAARLCARARPMEILVDEATRRRLPAGVLAEALPPLALKGFAAPVTVYRLAAAGALASAS
jgi:class 3 adenylate cyclase